MLYQKLQKLGTTTENVYKKSESLSKVHKIFNLGNSVMKWKQKTFLVIYSTLDGLSNDTTRNPLWWI